MKTCTKCGIEKPPEEFYPFGSWCKACKRAAAAQRSRTDYVVNGDSRRAYQRAYSNRRYAALTPEQRKALARESWRRWGRSRRLRELAARGAAHRASEDPELRFIRELSQAQDAETGTP